MDVLFNLDNENNFKTEIESIIKKLYDKQNDSSILKKNVVALVKEDIKNIIMVNNCNVNRIHELLSSKGYDTERIKIFSSIIESRRDQLLYLALVNYNSKYGDTVAEYNWVLKLVFGTSELKMLKYPLLQLFLTIFNDGECVQRGYDISKNELIKMISVLENIDN